MAGRARWILICTAILLVAGAFLWSCGGGGGSYPCTVGPTGVPVVPCGVPSPPGPNLDSIAICPGTAEATNVPTSTASITATPMLTPCPVASPTSVPANCSLQYHAIGIFSDGSTQDITNASTTIWTTSNSAIVSLNPSANAPAGNYVTVSDGSAVINASSGGVSGTSGLIIDVGGSGSCPASAAADDSEFPPYDPSQPSD